MRVKDKADVQTLIADARGGVAGDDVSDQVIACCAGVAALHADVAAIPIATIIALALQLIPIIFGEGGFTIEKLMAVLQLIASIFVPAP